MGAYDAFYNSIGKVPSGGNSGGSSSGGLVGGGRTILSGGAGNYSLGLGAPTQPNVGPQNSPAQQQGMNGSAQSNGGSGSEYSGNPRFVNHRRVGEVDNFKDKREKLHGFERAAVQGVDSAQRKLNNWWHFNESWEKVKNAYNEDGLSAAVDTAVEDNTAMRFLGGIPMQMAGGPVLAAEEVGEIVTGKRYQDINEKGEIPKERLYADQKIALVGDAIFNAVGMESAMGVAAKAGKSAAKGFIKSVASGIATEGAEEAAQSLLENKRAVGEEGHGDYISEGWKGRMLESAALGGFAGGVLGGGGHFAGKVADSSKAGVERETSAKVDSVHETARPTADSVFGDTRTSQFQERRYVGDAAIEAEKLRETVNTTDYKSTTTTKLTKLDMSAISGKKEQTDFGGWDYAGLTVSSIRQAIAGSGGNIDDSVRNLAKSFGVADTDTDSYEKLKSIVTDANYDDDKAAMFLNDLIAKNGFAELVVWKNPQTNYAGITRMRISRISSGDNGFSANGAIAKLFNWDADGDTITLSFDANLLANNLIRYASEKIISDFGDLNVDESVGYLGIGQNMDGAKKLLADKIEALAGRFNAKDINDMFEESYNRYKDNRVAQVSAIISYMSNASLVNAAQYVANQYPQNQIPFSVAGFISNMVVNGKMNTNTSMLKVNRSTVKAALVNSGVKDDVAGEIAARIVSEYRNDFNFTYNEFQVETAEDNYQHFRNTTLQVAQNQKRLKDDIENNLLEDASENAKEIAKNVTTSELGAIDKFLIRFLTGEVSYFFSVDGSGLRDNFSFRGSMARLLEVLKPDKNALNAELFNDAYDVLTSKLAGVSWETGKPENAYQALFSTAVMYRSLSKAGLLQRITNDNNAMFSSKSEFDSFIREYFVPAYNDFVAIYNDSLKELLADGSYDVPFDVLEKSKLNPEKAGKGFDMSITTAFKDIFGNLEGHNVMPIEEGSRFYGLSLNRICSIVASDKGFDEQFDPDSYGLNSMIEDMVKAEKLQGKRAYDFLENLWNDNNGLSTIIKSINGKLDRNNVANRISLEYIYMAIQKICGAKITVLADVGDMNHLDGKFDIALRKCTSAREFINVITSIMVTGKYKQIASTIRFIENNYSNLSETNIENLKAGIEAELVALTENGGLDSILANDIIEKLDANDFDLDNYLFVSMGSIDLTIDDKTKILGSDWHDSRKGNGVDRFVYECLNTSEGTVANRMKDIKESSNLVKKAHDRGQASCLEDWNNLWESKKSGDIKSLVDTLDDMTSRMSYKLNMSVVANAIHGLTNLNNSAIEKSKAQRSMSTFYFMMAAITGHRPSSWVQDITDVQGNNLSINEFWASSECVRRCLFGRQTYFLRDDENPSVPRTMNVDTLYEVCTGEKRNSEFAGKKLEDIELNNMVRKMPSIVNYLVPSTITAVNSSGNTIMVTENASGKLVDSVSEYMSKAAESSSAQDKLDYRMQTEMLRRPDILSMLASRVDSAGSSIGELNRLLERELEEFKKESIEAMAYAYPRNKREKRFEEIKRNMLMEMGREIFEGVSSSVRVSLGGGLNPDRGTANRLATRYEELVSALLMEDGGLQQLVLSSVLCPDGDNIRKKLAKASKGNIDKKQQDLMTSIGKASAELTRSFVVDILLGKELGYSRTTIPSLDKSSDYFTGLSPKEQQQVEYAHNLLTGTITSLDRGHDEKLGVSTISYRDYRRLSKNEKIQYFRKISESLGVEDFSEDVFKKAKNKKSFIEIQTNINSLFLRSYVESINRTNNTALNVDVLHQSKASIDSYVGFLQGLMEDEEITKLIEDSMSRIKQNDGKAPYVKVPSYLVDTAGSAISTLAQVNFDSSSVEVQIGIDGSMQPKSTVFGYLAPRNKVSDEVADAYATGKDDSNDVDPFCSRELRRRRRAVELIRKMIATGMEDRLLKFKKQYKNPKNTSVDHRVTNTYSKLNLSDYENLQYYNNNAAIREKWQEYVEKVSDQLFESIKEDVSVLKGLNAWLGKKALKDVVKLLSAPIRMTVMTRSGESRDIVVSIHAFADKPNDGHGLDAQVGAALEALGEDPSNYRIDGISFDMMSLDAYSAKMRFEFVEELDRISSASVEKGQYEAFDLLDEISLRARTNWVKYGTARVDLDRIRRAAGHLNVVRSNAMKVDDSVPGASKFRGFAGMSFDAKSNSRRSRIHARDVKVSESSIDANSIRNSTSSNGPDGFLVTTVFSDKSMSSLSQLRDDVGIFRVAGKVRDAGGTVNNGSEIVRPMYSSTSEAGTRKATILSYRSHGTQAKKVESTIRDILTARDNGCDILVSKSILADIMGSEWWRMNRLPQKQSYDWAVRASIQGEDFIRIKPDALFNAVPRGGLVFESVSIPKSQVSDILLESPKTMQMIDSAVALFDAIKNRTFEHDADDSVDVTTLFKRKGRSSTYSIVKDRDVMDRINDAIYNLSDNGSDLIEIRDGEYLDISYYRSGSLGNQALSAISELARNFNEKKFSNTQAVAMIKQTSVDGGIVYAPVINSGAAKTNFIVQEPELNGDYINYSFVSRRNVSGAKDSFKVSIIGYPMKDIAANIDTYRIVSLAGEAMGIKLPEHEFLAISGYIDRNILAKRNEGRDKTYSNRLSMYNFSRDHAYNVFYDIEKDGSAKQKDGLTKFVTDNIDQLVLGNTALWAKIADGEASVFDTKKGDPYAIQRNELIAYLARQVRATNANYSEILCPARIDSKGKAKMYVHSNYSWELMFGDTMLGWNDFLMMFNTLNKRFCPFGYHGNLDNSHIFDNECRMLIKGERIKALVVDLGFLDPKSGKMYGASAKFSDQAASDAVMSGQADIGMYLQSLRAQAEMQNAVRLGKDSVYRGAFDSPLITESLIRKMNLQATQSTDTDRRINRAILDRRMEFDMRKPAWSQIDPSCTEASDMMHFVGFATFMQKLDRFRNNLDKKPKVKTINDETYDFNSSNDKVMQWSDDICAAFGLGTNKSHFSDRILFDIVIRGQLGWSYSENTKNDVLSEDDIDAAVRTLCVNIREWKNGRRRWFIEPSSNINGRYTIPMLTQRTNLWIAKHMKVDYDSIVSEQDRLMSAQLDDIKLITKPSKRFALIDMSEFMRADNGCEFEIDYIYGTIRKSERDALMDRMGRFVSESEEDRQHRMALIKDAEEISRQLAELSKSEQISFMSETIDGSVVTVPNYRANNTLMIKVGRDICNLSRAMSLINPFLPISSNIDKGVRSITSGIEMRMSLRGLIPFYSGGQNLNVSEAFNDIVTSAASNPVVLKILETLSVISLNGDETAVLAQCRTIEDVEAVLDRIREQQGWSDKIYSAAAKWSSGLNSFKKTEAKRFFQALALNLNFMNNTRWFTAVDEHGTTLFESELMNNPSKLLLEVLVNPQNNDSWLAAQRALNISRNTDMGTKNLISIIYKHLSKKYPMLDVFNCAFGCKFVQYKTNQLGRVLNVLLPMSSLHHLATRYVMENGRVISMMSGGRIDENISAEASTILFHQDLKSAIVSDIAKIGLFWTTVTLASLAAFQPPEDEDKWCVASEWTIFGYRVDAVWWIEDTLGIAIPGAAFIRTCMLGNPKMELLTRGVAEFAYYSPMTNTLDFIDLLLDPDTEITDTEGLVGDWSDAEGGQPGVSEILATKSITVGLSGIANLFTPSMFKELYRALPEYEKSYKLIYEEDERGNLTEDGANGKTEKTSYHDAMLRKLSKSNPLIAIMLNLALQPNTSFWATKMPDVNILDTRQMKSSEEHSIYDENGMLKENKDAIAAEVVATLQSTDDMQALWEQGYYIPYDTKEYIGVIVANRIKTLKEDYYSAQANNMFYWKNFSDDYEEGYAAATKAKQAYWDEIEYWNGFYYNKLWCDELNRSIVSYRRYNTTYARDENGNYFATGIRNNLTSILPFNVAPGSLYNAEGTAGYDEDWATISYVDGKPMYDENQNGQRALVPNIKTLDAPNLNDIIEELGGSNGSGTPTQTTANKTNDDDESNKKNKNVKYGGSRRSGGGGGGGSRGGGGGGTPYQKTINHTKVSAGKMGSYNTSKGTRIYGADLDYLRPGFSTKGSRTAYRRNDI